MTKKDISTSASRNTGKSYPRRRRWYPDNLKQSSNTSSLRRRVAPQDYIFPECHEHELKRPNVPVALDVVPCDWVRTNNPSQFNEYDRSLTQCKIPRCQVCIFQHWISIKWKRRRRRADELKVDGILLSCRIVFKSKFMVQSLSG